MPALGIPALEVKEKITSALGSSHLETHPERESAIDRVGALARTTKLGGLLWRWVYGKQAVSGAVQQELLVKARRMFQISRMHPEYPTLERACRQCLVEWHDDQCQTCTGAGVLIADRLKITCSACLGTGRRRFQDQERINALRIEESVYRLTWDARMGRILGILGSHDRRAVTTTREQLE